MKDPNHSHTLAARLFAAALLLLPGLSAAPAQTAVEAWVRRYSQSVDTYNAAQKVVTDSAGNVIVAGRTTPNGIAVNDFLIIKYSGAGVLLWSNRYNGPANSDDVVSAMAVDGGGNLIVTLT